MQALYTYIIHNCNHHSFRDDIAAAARAVQLELRARVARTIYPISIRERIIYIYSITDVYTLYTCRFGLTALAAFLRSKINEILSGFRNFVGFLFFHRPNKNKGNFDATATEEGEK